MPGVIIIIMVFMVIHLPQFSLPLTAVKETSLTSVLPLTFVRVVGDPGPDWGHGHWVQAAWRADLSLSSGVSTFCVWCSVGVGFTDEGP